MSFQPMNSDVLYSRNDPQDPRLGDFVQLTETQKLNQSPAGFALAGYPDDEGIHLNKGRMGASQGPDAIRRILYKTTPPFHSQSTPHVYDIGNLETALPLAERHEAAKAECSSALQSGHKWIGLGGGHDYGYVDGASFLAMFREQQQKPLIINFDAHLDVRPTTHGLSSGTPFYRLLEEFSDFDFAEIGIQSQCNSKEHFNWCQQRGVRILTMDEILFSGESLSVVVDRFLNGWLERPRPTFISIDIDGFSSAFAMGCSQSWPTGLEPNTFMPVFDTLLKRLNVAVLGVYEVSPPLDVDNRTARLAAQLVHRYVFQS